jgi:hypothetical protein
MQNFIDPIYYLITYNVWTSKLLDDEIAAIIKMNYTHHLDINSIIMYL